MRSRKKVEVAEKRMWLRAWDIENRSLKWAWDLLKERERRVRFR